MPINSIPEGNYRIRQAGAKSEIANMISNGKKCFYVQIGSDLSDFGSLEDAMKFVEDKGLVADPMSIDFGTISPAPDANDDGDDDAVTV